MNPFILSIVTHNLDVQIHHHAAYQLVFSPEKPFQSIINGVLYPEIYGFLIQPQVSHLCTVHENSLFVVNIEPYSQAGLVLKTYFDDGTGQKIFNRPNTIRQVFDLSCDAPLLETISQKLQFSATVTPTDERVQQIIDLIVADFAQNHPYQYFADKVYLSPSRLAALFKAQTGSSLSKYLLWTRLRHAITTALTHRDLTLTEIAYQSGFYDQSQLNKYMYEMFGVPPKALRQNSDLIQVL